MEAAGKLVPMKLAVLIGLVVLTSGCIAFNETQEEETPATPPPPPEPKVLSGRIEAEHDFNVPTPYVAESRTPLEAGFEPPASTFRIDFKLQWANQGNAFRLVVEMPNGSETFGARSGAREISTAIHEPSPGPYLFYAEADALVMPDHLEGSATYHYTVDGENVTAAQPWVQVRRDGGAYIAYATLAAEGEVTESATFDIETINGAIGLTGTDSGKAQIEVGPWARAESEERARELVKSLSIDLAVADGTMLATVKHTVQPTERESLGAGIRAWTPATMGGEAETTNGDISVADLKTDDISLRTTNGGVDGSVISAGDLSAGTTNGRIELTYKPIASGTIEVDTTNGGIGLELAESDRIGYRVDAETTNGDVESDMDEADWSGDDEDGTLETEGFSSRAIQVTGSAHTTNGSIHFGSA